MNENTARIHDAFKIIFGGEEKWTACLFVVMPHPRDFQIEMQIVKSVCDAERARSPYDLWFTKSNQHKTTIVREQYEIAHRRPALNIPDRLTYRDIKECMVVEGMSIIQQEECELARHKLSEAENCRLRVLKTSAGTNT
jgi:hypothetical protein